ncbi:MAG: hypothetical protein ACRDOU_26035 [Streptosporangiaceae bacterium]
MIAIVVVVAIALVAVGVRKRKTAILRERFGPEYDRAVENRGDQRAAEAELRARERERAQFEVMPLPEATRLRFAAEWRDVQENFVDQPAQATTAADILITRVMEARGYPMKDFDVQADLVSVDYPDTVENYRFAHAVRQRSETQQASTEDLREALLRYRSLFDELLRPDSNGAAEGTAAQAQPVGASSRQRGTAVPDPRDPGSSVTGQTDGPTGMASDGAGPADPDYYDQRTGR